MNSLFKVHPLCTRSQNILKNDDSDQLEVETETVIFKEDNEDDPKEDADDSKYDD